MSRQDAIFACRDERLRGCENRTGQLAVVEILEKPSEFLGVVEEEPYAVVCEAPFEIFVVVGREVESEGCGAEEAVEFGGVDE